MHEIQKFKANSAGALDTILGKKYFTKRCKVPHNS